MLALICKQQCLPWLNQGMIREVDVSKGKIERSLWRESGWKHGRRLTSLHSRCLQSSCPLTLLLTDPCSLLFLHCTDPLQSPPRSRPLKSFPLQTLAPHLDPSRIHSQTNSLLGIITP